MWLPVAVSSTFGIQSFKRTESTHISQFLLQVLRQMLMAKPLLRYEGGSGLCAVVFELGVPYLPVTLCHESLVHIDLRIFVLLDGVKGYANGTEAQFKDDVVVGQREHSDSHLGSKVLLVSCRFDDEFCRILMERNTRKDNEVWDLGRIWEVI